MKSICHRLPSELFVLSPNTCSGTAQSATSMVKRQRPSRIYWLRDTLSRDLRFILFRNYLLYSSKRL